MNDYGDGFGKTGITVQQPDGTFKVEVTSEELVRANRWVSFGRHLVKLCTCSWCNPYSLKTYKPLPKPGRFGIGVPPRENRWRWTHVHLRVGDWMYYFSARFQMFPSIWPFFHAEEWEEKTCEVQRSA